MSWIKIVDKEDKKRYIKKVKNRSVEVVMLKSNNSYLRRQAKNNEYLIEYTVTEDFPDGRRLRVYEKYYFRKTKESAKRKFKDVLRKIDKHIFSQM